MKAECETSRHQSEWAVGSPQFFFLLVCLVGGKQTQRNAEAHLNTRIKEEGGNVYRNKTLLLHVRLPAQLFTWKCVLLPCSSLGLRTKSNAEICTV